MIQYTRFFTIAFLLLLFQVLVFDHVDLFGFGDPPFVSNSNHLSSHTRSIRLYLFGLCYRIFIGFTDPNCWCAHYRLCKHRLYATVDFPFCFRSKLRPTQRHVYRYVVDQPNVVPLPHDHYPPVHLHFGGLF